MKKILTSALFVFCLIGSATVRSEEMTAPASQSIPPCTLEKVKELDHVFFLMQKRLSIMHEVARWKWNTKTEIEDFPREQQALKRIGKLAAAYGLNRDWALDFFQAQIDAAKLVQQSDFDYWIEVDVKEFDFAADLHTEINPYLDRLTKELIQALVDVAPYFKDHQALSLIPPIPLSTRPYDFVEEAVWAKAVSPLYKFTQ